ncbi:MAG: Dam family site-specific DNA-(adenine-N6)-methyltransferase [Myxococcota bacterium]
MRPILQWAGGKSKLAGQIAQALGGPCTGTYYEPFVGSAAVFLHLKELGWVRRAVLSDANDKLCAVHRAVRDDVEGVLNALRAMPSDDWRDRYYEVRADYNRGPFDDVVHAARFIWLNRAGYNGLYRENRRGEFNVPCGKYAALKMPDDDHFRRVSFLLQDTEIRSVPFEDVLSDAGEGDQVYCDPPYVPLSPTACFTGYCSRVFDLAEQKLLARCARRAAYAGATVVLSNHDLPVVRNELYPPTEGFRHVAKPRVARAISRGARGRVDEVIAAIGPWAASSAA